MKRRSFIFDIFSVGFATAISSRLNANNLNSSPVIRSISTWNNTKEANLTAGRLLDKGKSSIDAVVEGVAVSENDPKNTTVGFGGAPDMEK